MKGNIEIVILAAGESKRFGSPKQLAHCLGKPLLQHSVDLSVSSSLKVHVALGANIKTILSDPSVDLSRCHIIHVIEWQKGLSTSIRESLAQCQQRSSLEGIIFLLADQPLMTQHDIDLLIESAQKNPETIVCARYHRNNGQEKIGVPAYFPAGYFAALAKLKGDAGAKSIIEVNSCIVLDFEHEMIDIDDQNDLIRVKSRYLT